MPNEIQKVLDEMKTTTEALHKYVDRKVEEVRAGGTEGDATTNEAINKANDQITELRKLYDGLLVQSKRPAGFAMPDDEVDEEGLLKRQAFEKFVRYGSGEGSVNPMTADEKRALANSADKDGGFLIPTDFENEIIMNAYNEAEIRPTVGAKPTSRDTVFLPALGKPKVAWGVTGLAVDQQELEAGGNTIQIHDVKALTLLHNNTLEDADADIWGELNEAFADAIAEAEDTAFATGDGSRSPQGFLVHEGVAANTTLSGVSGALTDATHNGIDVLIDALYKLKKTYRRNATFAFNSTVEATVRKIKDGDGQYLWQPPVQAGDPATLLGKPVINPEDMPDATTNGLTPIAVGDFKRGYRIRDRKGVTVQRLAERYAEYDQVGFMLKKRVGGQTVLPEAFQLVKIGT